MIVKDERTYQELRTHPNLVVGTDTFLSGWGPAEGGTSVAAWACKDEHLHRVLAWVRGRGDMKQVRVRSGNYRPAKAKHFHVYVVRDGHPALA